MNLTETEMLSWLEYKTEDKSGRFTTPERYLALNSGMRKVVNDVDHHYLTVLKYPQVNLTLTNGIYNITSLTYGVIKGERGILDVIVTGGKRITMYEVSELKIFDNPYMNPIANDPAGYIYDNKIYILPTTIANIDVLYLRPPTNIASGVDCELESTLHYIIVKYAAAELFENVHKLDRSVELRELADEEIKSLNEIYEGK